MSQLSLFLPPFAGDYSGACSVLFPCNCMVVILDAGCCTRSYAEYDEPRWTSRRKPAFSAQIRTLDTVMGDEAGVIGQVVDAAGDLEPSCIALVGTPVPAIVGMDLAGMAGDVARESGIPCLGVPTNGFETYERGISRALAALAEAFAVPDIASSGLVSRAAIAVPAAGDFPEGSLPERPLRVNLLGATPLDLSSGDAVERWRDLLQERGIEVPFDGTAPFDAEDVAAWVRADASVAVSWGGLRAARLLWERAGVPYAVGVPVDERAADLLAARVRRAVRGGRPAEGFGHPAAERAAQPKLLLVGDQVAMGSLRESLMQAGSGLDAVDVAVATFFSCDATLACEGDLALREDSDLEAYLRAHPDAVAVGDPLLARLPALSEDRLIPVIHPAVSGPLFADADDARFRGEGLASEILDRIAR